MYAIRSYYEALVEHDGHRVNLASRDDVAGVTGRYGAIRVVVADEQATQLQEPLRGAQPGCAILEDLDVDDRIGSYNFV